MEDDLKIKDLEYLILKHKNLYYQGRAEISDFEYDRLEDDLKDLCPESPILAMVGSTLFRDEKVEHDKKMLSLNKTYKLDELIKWSGEKDTLSTFKIDGSSCSLVYESGNLKMAKTRGDGRFGENITRKILFIDHVPKQVQKRVSFEVRGEVYCTEESFIRISQEMEKKNLERPSSQRNIVAGLLGRKENIEFCQYLSFQAFELLSEDIELQTEEEKFHTLQELGFETPDFFINRSKEDFQARLDESKNFMAYGNYLIDGLVFSFNDLGLHSSMGETAHHPRYKMAFKFQGETKVTSILSIAWQVSRNGILTPVANVSPVEISGAKVSRVTLHNYGMLKQHNLKVGDTIEIVRSGEVIPKFLAVVKSSEEKFQRPLKCPSCGENIFEEDIRLVCKNDVCPDKVKDEILNFIRKIGIEDLSTKRLEELIKANLVKDIPSLFEITKEQLLTLDKVQDKLADKVLANINKAKEASLTTVLASLGISGGAFNKCEKIVLNGHDTIDKILELTPAKLELIESFAEKSANEFIRSLKTKKKIIKKLRGYGFDFKHLVKARKTSPIAGQKFCITGTLSMKRSELQQVVKENGGIVQSSISKDTSYLITNDAESSSSKFKKAKQLGVSVISEEQFFTLI